MRKFICTLLILCIIMSSFGATTVAFADDDDDDFDYFSYSVSTDVDNNDNSTYYAFNKPTKIATSSDYIAVLEENDYGKKQLTSFDSSGEFLYSTLLNDPRDVEIIGNYAYVLDYDLVNEFANIYQVDLRSGTGVIVISEIISRDIASDGEYLYVLKAGLVQGIARYHVGANVYTPDYYFEDGDVFMYSTAISIFEDNILGFQSFFGSPSIMVYNTKTKTSFNITDMPEGGISEFFYDGSKVYILNSTGVYIGDLSEKPNFALALSPSDSTISLNENIIDPISFAFDESSQNGIYVLDGENSLSVKKFVTSNNLLTSGMFAISSFSGEVGSFHSPTDVTYSDGDSFYADSLNNRITIRSSKGKYTAFDTIDEEGEKYEPLYVGVDYSSNIYVATIDKIYKYSSSYELLDSYDSSSDRRFSGITALYVSDVSHEVYAIDGSKIIALDPESNEFKVLKPSGSSSEVFTIDMRFNRYIYGNGNSLSIYDMKTNNRITSLDVGSNSTFDVRDVTTDFNGSIYVLVESPTYSYIFKYILKNSEDDKDKEEYIEAGQIRIEDNIGFKSFTLDNDDEAIYLIPTSEHRIHTISTYGYKKLDIEYTPSIDIPKDIFNQEYDKDVTIGTVIDDGNRLIYPPERRDSLYPVNYSITRTRKLDDDALVVVAGYTEDKEYAYVIANNAAGFMDASALKITDQNKNVPFDSGVSLHDNMYVYKYPLLTVYDHEPLYSINQIQKNVELDIINNASDYVCPAGLYWYKVSFEVDNDTLYGYIPRYNAVENLNETNPNLEFGKISADLLHGKVDVYADLGVTKIGKSLQDNSKVIILDVIDNYVYIQEVTDSGDGVIGYIFKDNLTTEAQTKSQTTALILIAILVAVVGILLGIKSIMKKRSKSF